MRNNYQILIESEHLNHRNLLMSFMI